MISQLNLKNNSDKNINDTTESKEESVKEKIGN